MNQYEKEKKAIEAAMREQVDAYQAIYKKATTEDRKPSDDERLEIEAHLERIETLKKEREVAEENIKTLQRVEDLGRQIGPADQPEFDAPRVKVGGDRQDRMVKSLGELFVESESYQNLVEVRQKTGTLPQGFATAPVSMQTKGTLLEGAGAPGTGTGGGLVTVPQVVPGQVETLFQRLSVADVLGSGQATTNSIRYVVEGTATSGAAGVAEGGLKPESTLALSTKDEPIKKIATILPISEEMLEDAPQVQSYINGRLTLFVRIEEERQLVRGTSGGNEVQGLLTSRTVPVYAGGTAAGNKAVQLFKAINGTRGSSFVEPDFVIMHPSDYQDIRLLADTSGQLFGGGPFFGPYGGPQGPAGIGQGQLTGATEQVWGKPVILTTATGAGTAVIGSQAAATVFRRGGLSVDATNSHSDYFQRNLVAIRAEERLGLAVYRPSAFCEIRLS